MATFSKHLLILLLIVSPWTLWAKGDNEVGAAFSYYDRKATVDGAKVQITESSMDALYLQSYKAIWTGGEISYLSYRSTSSSEGYLSFGVPVKYWLMGPESKGVGLYSVVTPYFGNDNSRGMSGTIMGLRMALGMVVFMNDMLGIDSKLFYDFRTGGTPSTTMGLKIGFSIYF